MCKMQINRLHTVLNTDFLIKVNTTLHLMTYQTSSFCYRLEFIMGQSPTTTRECWINQQAERKIRIQFSIQQHMV